MKRHKKMIQEKIQVRRVTGRGSSKCKGLAIGMFGGFKKEQYHPYNLSNVSEGGTAGRCD